MTNWLMVAADRLKRLKELRRIMLVRRAAAAQTIEREVLNALHRHCVSISSPAVKKAVAEAAEIIAKTLEPVPEDIA
jgi:hypothetical protein